MNNFKVIVRFILGGFTAVASISILVSIIYLFSDYEKNIMLNSNLDDYTLPIMIVVFIIFACTSVLAFINGIKIIKNYKNR